MSSITSAGASETDSARKRGPGGAPDDFRTAAAGQAHVDQHDVGMLGVDCGDAAVDVGAFSYELDAVAEFAADTGAESRVIVDDNDS